MVVFQGITIPTEALVLSGLCGFSALFLLFVIAAYIWSKQSESEQETGSKEDFQHPIKEELAEPEVKEAAEPISNQPIEKEEKTIPDDESVEDEDEKKVMLALVVTSPKKSMWKPNAKKGIFKISKKKRN
ncbi:hypothetical protein KJ780_00450 [Candidatus Micrarchaeota archaeon]|nr:hypothetical protein [Candidatus Micrarchaeota archaeon]